jgi:ABC-type multidrug transport system fused ATPase/permease subunit
MEQIRKLSFLLHGFRSRLFFLIVLFLMLSILDLISLKLIGMLAQSIINPSFSFYGRDFIEASTSLSPVTAFYLFTCFLFTIKFSCALSASYLSSRITDNVLISLRDQLYTKLLNSEYEIYLKKEKSEYLNRIFSITASFCHGVLLSTLKMISEIMVSFSIIIYLLIYNTLSIAIISILFIFFIIFYDLFIRKLMYKLGETINTNNNKIISLINETVDGFKEIRIFNATESYHKDFKRISEALSNANTKSQFLISFPRFALEYILILSFLFYALIYFNLNVGENIIPGLTVLGYSAMRLLPSFSAISNGLSQYRSGKNNINQLYEDLIFKIEATTLDTGQNKLIFNKLELNNISVQYKENTVFNNISLTINKGSFIGIIGKSGSGKTTLLNLILGLLKPNSGVTLLNGQPTNLSSSIFQNILAIVSQKNFIPKGTIDNAITFKSDVSPEKLRAVINRSSLDEFISSLNNNYDYLLDENANNASGGQAQRLAIARALYFNRQLLVLDEPTSSLDEQSEKSILNNLVSLRGSVTIIMATHKKECLNICDEIYELSDYKLIKVK